MIETIAKVIGIALMGLIAIVALSFIGAIPVYFLWNWLMPEIFGVPAVSLVQAWGLLFLSGMLFKSSSKSNSD